MNTVITQSTKTLLITGVLCLCIKTGMAQRVSTAKNFVGVNGSILWNTSSVSSGLQGERIISSKQNKELSLKGSYTFRHHFGNMILFFRSPYDISSAEAGLGVGGYLFTGKDKTNTGFFLSAGAGALYSHWKIGEDNFRYIRPAAELGFGLKWKLGDNMALRWSNELKWASPQPESEGAVITTTALALGF